MLMKNKAEEAAQQIREAFSSPYNLPKALASVFVSRHDGSPCRSWSWSNQLLVAINGYSDARTFRQWEKVSRHVLKGERSFRILSPLTKKSVDEESGKERTVIYGFTGIPVFGLEQTVGDPLPHSEEETQEWLRNLPLSEVAEAWEHSGRSFNGREARDTGRYRSKEGKKGSPLGVREVPIWCHELIHAADDRNGRSKGSKVKREIIAELGGTVLLTLIGREHKSDLGGWWQYIRQYAGSDNDRILKACGEVLNRTCEAVALILDTAEALRSKSLTIGGSDRPEISTAAEVE